MSLQDTQGAISAAVTPVVMISANAILASAVSSKHQAMSDRVRALTAEWRNAATTAARRESISQQLRLFQERLRWLSWSHILLYAATACFIAMVIAIAMSPSVEAMSGVPLAMLLTGVGMMLVGILLELFDLSKARATTGLEISDVLAAPHSHPPLL